MLSQRSILRAQQAMAAELKRTLAGIGARGHKKPFFASYLLHYSDSLDVWGRYGAIFRCAPQSECTLFADLRVGSHRNDQTLDGGLRAQRPEDRESWHWLAGPEDLDPAALRYALWRLSKLRYSEALQDYYEKQKVEVDHDLSRGFASFSHEPVVRHSERVRGARFDVPQSREFVRRCSRHFRRYRRLEDPYVQLQSALRSRIFVNSEGSRFVTQDEYHQLVVSAARLSKDGAELSSIEVFHARRPGELPREQDVLRAIDRISKDLDDQERARPMDPYAGPALLSGIATGLLFHEAIGHRLEGERLLSRAEGHTFAKKIGRPILPRGVDLVDDPSLERFEKQPLFGHYRVDDEGVRAQRVVLVKDGVLKTFLTSRNCVEGIRRSNGHGRHERFHSPMARMGNLVVEVEERKPLAELKRMLLERVRERGLPYGIYVKKASSGETATSLDQYSFQGFKGNPTHVVLIDAKTGKESRVRDVNFIGTPLVAIQHIRAFGGDYEVDNSFCFAESGSVPVGTVAPSMLVEELELQRSSHTRLRAPTLPLPPMG